MLSRSLSHYSTSFTSLTDKPHHEAFRIMDAEVVKLLLVGDEKCGKTTFLSYVSVESSHGPISSTHADVHAAGGSAPASRRIRSRCFATSTSRTSSTSTSAVRNTA